MVRTPLDLVFDLDGTLVDSAPDLHAAINRLLDSDGRRQLELTELVPMVGDGVPALVRRAYEATGGAPRDMEARIDRYRALYGDALADRTAPYPGVVETLETLQAAGHRMAVCTNKPERPTIEILETLGLMRFISAVAGGDSLPVRKPDPGHLLGALEMLGADAKRSVMIGDSRNDVAVARAAGVAVIAVSYGYRREPVEDLGADLTVDSFGELPGALAALSRGSR